MNKYILKDNTEIEAIPFGSIKCHIGDKNNRLTICDRAPNGKGKKTRVICQCECGNYTCINLQDFIDGKVKSCGCFATERKTERCKQTAINFLNQNTNPFYEFICPTDLRYHGQIMWKVQCRKCKKEYIIPPNDLIWQKRTHGLNPCDCNKVSSVGVQVITQILEQNNIQYVKEKTFNTCVSPKDNLLRFDFYLPDYNILIEYDGRQHFEVAFGKNEDKLILQQQYDEIKNVWCKENNIKLIRIPYTQRNITINDLLGKEQ